MDNERRNDTRFMARCLTLARMGAGQTAPNPMVGAVVVHAGRIIGEGFHRAYGGPHAEVNAIAAVRDASLLPASTLYVSLEPCSHQGKTPPCTELILRTGIRRVVVACTDPFPAVSGRGIRRLREAGMEVTTGVLEAEARRLNRFFLTAQTARRPYIILKWAESADGFIDRTRSSAAVPAVRLSDAVTMRAVHRLRAEVGAIMVGARTAMLDDPSLTVRHWVGANPMRILLDYEGSVSGNLHLFDGAAPTLVFTANQSATLSATLPTSVELLHLDVSQPALPQILRVLHERRIDSLLVEGGAYLHGLFIDSGLWDEARIETTSLRLGDGVQAADLRSHGGAIWQRDLYVTPDRRISVYLHTP